MPERERESLDDTVDTTVPDLDAAAGPSGRPRGGELPENEDLDSEGQPDLIGALPGKEITGDAQEGEIAPREYKQAPDDYYHQDTLDERLAEERSDRVRADTQEVRPLDEESETGGNISTELGDEGGYPSAEEAAMHVADKVPGGVDKDIDSYTGEPVEELE